MKVDASPDSRHHARRVPSVAYQGEPGAFSEMAARVLFHDGITTLPRRRLQAVADAVVRGEAHFGVVPVENSSVGGVRGACDVLASGPMEVVAEVVLPVRLALLAPEGANLDDVQGVRSHPVALAQCDGFLDTHGLEPRACHDTAGAAREVAEAADPAVAAVAGRAAARRYGLRVLADGIQDRPDNRTRFLLVARRGRGWQYRYFLELAGDAAGRSFRGVMSDVSEDGGDGGVAGVQPDGVDRARVRRSLHRAGYFRRSLSS